MKLACSLRITLAMVLVLALEAPGQTPPAPAPGSPEETVARAVNAMNKDRLDEFAADMHPDAVKRFREGMMKLVDAAVKDGKEDQVLRLFSDAKSVADVKALDDRQFILAYIRGAMRAQSGLKQILAGAKIEILGHVDDGKDKAHVVYNMVLNADGQHIEKITVNSLQKNGQKWALLLNGDMESMVVMAIQTAAGKPVLPDMKKSRVEVLGQLYKARDTGPVYVVYRMTTPFGDVQASKMDVLTVAKSDPSWAVVERGKPEELVGLIRKSVGLDEAQESK